MENCVVGTLLDNHSLVHNHVHINMLAKWIQAVFCRGTKTPFEESILLVSHVLLASTSSCQVDHCHKGFKGRLLLQ